MSHEGSDDYQLAITMLQSGSLDLAMKKLEVLGSKGNGHAYAIMGAMYEFGKGNIPQDQRRALRLYELAIASAGSLQAWMGVGRICLTGSDEMRDFKRAKECFQIAAQGAEYPQAYLALGKIYLYGLGVGQQLSLAREFFLKAALLGNVFGYTGLAKVEMAEGHLFRSIYFRLVATVKVFKNSVTKSPKDNSLQVW